MDQILVRPDGTQAWVRDGQLHRDDGPAIEDITGTRHWYKNGKRHREDGPAIEWDDGRKEWYLDGEPLTKLVWRAKMGLE